MVNMITIARTILLLWYFINKINLRNIGFNFDAVKKKWAEQGYLIKDKNGRYANHTKVDSEKGYYVRLKYDGM